jgi:hypothetical protein
MNSENFIDKYFDKAMKIHQICLDKLKLSVEDARLYVYIYVQSIEKGGLNYFNSEDNESIEAIKIIMEKMKNNSQLEDRLRLHTDKDFTRKKISFYIDYIMSEIG